MQKAVFQGGIGNYIGRVQRGTFSGLILLSTGLFSILLYALFYTATKKQFFFLFSILFSFFVIFAYSLDTKQLNSLDSNSINTNSTFCSFLHIFVQYAYNYIYNYIQSAFFLLFLHIAICFLLLYILYILYTHTSIQHTYCSQQCLLLCLLCYTKEYKYYYFYRHLANADFKRVRELFLCYYSVLNMHALVEIQQKAILRDC